MPQYESLLMTEMVMRMGEAAEGTHSHYVLKPHFLPSAWIALPGLFNQDCAL